MWVPLRSSSTPDSLSRTDGHYTDMRTNEAPRAKIALLERTVPALWRDLAAVALATAAAAVLCAQLNVSEVLRRWTAPWERIQLDELPAVLLVLALGLVWFAARRYREARREILRRKAAEGRLAAALADNRRLSQQYVTLQEAERKSLARELHDELGQYLNVIKLDAVSIRDDRLTERGTLGERARVIVENCNHIHAALTGLLRQLRPVGLDELGLAAALEHCINTWRAPLLKVDVCLSLAEDFADVGEALALTLYRLVQEALTNVAKHAHASHVTVQLERSSSGDAGPDGVTVMIEDDGVGAVPSAPTRGLGLIGMRERVAALGGTLEVTSSPGCGFQLRAWMPVLNTLPPRHLCPQ
jgi:two-component system, NarL family, sensor histidine kinase UhpB